MRIPATSDFRDIDGLSDFALANLDYFAPDGFWEDGEDLPADSDDEEAAALEAAEAARFPAAENPF